MVGRPAFTWKARPMLVHFTLGRCLLWQIQTMAIGSIFVVAKLGRTNWVTWGRIMSYSLKAMVVQQSLKSVIVHVGSMVHQPVF